MKTRNTYPPKSIQFYLCYSSLAVSLNSSTQHSCILFHDLPTKLHTPNQQHFPLHFQSPKYPLAPIFRRLNQMILWQAFCLMVPMRCYVLSLCVPWGSYSRAKRPECHVRDRVLDNCIIAQICPLSRMLAEVLSDSMSPAKLVHRALDVILVRRGTTIIICIRVTLKIRNEFKLAW